MLSLGVDALSSMDMCDMDRDFPRGRLVGLKSSVSPSAGRSCLEGTVTLSLAAKVPSSLPLETGSGGMGGFSTEIGMGSCVAVNGIKLWIYEGE